MKHEEKASFTSEADLVAAYCKALGSRSDEEWTAYHETAGWDLLMVRKSDGCQVGIEAKLSLNPHVVAQCLGRGYSYDESGPDFRAVLVPETGLQNYMAPICKHLGIVVICLDRRSSMGRTSYRALPSLPRDDDSWTLRDWPRWLPLNNHRLPDYVPDVVGGAPSPVLLSDWKIRAIKLLLVLERKGAVNRGQLKAKGKRDA